MKTKQSTTHNGHTPPPPTTHRPRAPFSIARVLTLIVAAASATMRTPAAADLILDQSFDAIGTGALGGITVNTKWAIAQTFPVNLTGMLSQVDLQLRQIESTPPTGDATLDILNTSAGVPTTSRGTLNIDQATVPSFLETDPPFINVDISSLGIMVSPGDVLAIVLTMNHPGDYTWLFAGGDPYPQGDQLEHRLTEDTWREITNSFDLGFQTWVDTDATVPEPATLAVLTLVALIRPMRRHNR